jgi:hypothetical protein
MRMNLVAALVTAFSLVTATDAALSDDLKGYSIDTTYTTHAVPGVVVAGEMGKQGLKPWLHHDRIYISVMSNVFSYSDTSLGDFAAHGGNETQLDKAKTVSRDRMQAWTVEPGRLLRIVHEIEGTLVVTYVIDPSRTTCTVSYAPNPDPQTGRMVAQTIGGVTVEIKAMSVDSATCVVRKGNVFASDQ